MQRGLKKFERLLALIYFLKRRKSARALDIARHHGITERTVYRDIAALNEAFGDYVQVVGTPDGYSLDTRIYAPPLRLIPEELAALQTAVAALEPNNPHYQLAHQAFSKLESQSGDFLDLTALENRLAVMPSTAKDLVPLKRLQELETAIENKQLIRIRYFSHHSRAVKNYTIDPYSLLFRKQAWYLLGRDVERDRVLLLRAFRIHAISSLEAPSTKPANFNVREYFKSHWEVFDGKPETVQLQFQGIAALLIEEMQWHPSQELKPQPDGMLQLHLKVPVSPEFITWVMGWGADCTVLEPKHLWATVKNHLQHLNAAYQ